MAVRIFIILFLSSCTTHRVFTLNKCRGGKIIFFNTKKTKASESVDHSLLVLGDGKDHPQDISYLSKSGRTFNCDNVKKIALNFRYNWKDVLFSFVPFVSQKSLDLFFVMDGD